MAKRSLLAHQPPPAAHRLVCASELLRQTPTGHIIGPFRMALLISPCCQRRIRALLIQGKTGWRLREEYRRCPRCRFSWRLEVKITKNGYISTARFKAPGQARLVRQKRAKKQPK